MMIQLHNSDQQVKFIEVNGRKWLADQGINVMGNWYESHGYEGQDCDESAYLLAWAAEQQFDKTAFDIINGDYLRVKLYH